MPTPDELAAQLRDWLEHGQALADEVAALDTTPEPQPEPEPLPEPQPEAPAKPTGLACVIGPDMKPVLSWDNPGGVDEWDVRDELNLAKPVQVTVTQPRSTRSPLKPGQHRRYTVVARNATGDSEPSDAVDVPPAQEPEPTPGATLHPSDILDLRNWTVMLPTGAQGDPDNDYRISETVPDVFFVDPTDRAVVFRVDVVNGVHSSGSKYPRTEAREMTDTKWVKAAWPSTGPRWLEADLAIDTSHLSTRRRCNGIQIHDAADDVCQIMAREDGKLGLAHNDGASFEVIDPDYTGGRFVCRLDVSGDRIKVSYNGRQVVDVPKKGTSWYWKYGAYAQTGGASTYKEPAGSYAQVKVWSVTTGTS